MVNFQMISSRNLRRSFEGVRFPWTVERFKVWTSKFEFLSWNRKRTALRTFSPRMFLRTSTFGGKKKLKFCLMSKFYRLAWKLIIASKVSGKVNYTTNASDKPISWPSYRSTMFNGHCSVSASTPSAVRTEPIAECDLWGKQKSYHQSKLLMKSDYH